MPTNMRTYSENLLKIGPVLSEIASVEHDYSRSARQRQPGGLNKERYLL